MLRGGSTLLLAMINGCRVGVKKLLELLASLARLEMNVSSVVDAATSPDG